MRVQRGFTLIEIMMVVVIISILAAIAVPAYTDYLRRGRISEAVNGLSDIRVRLEQFFQDNRSFPTNGAPCVASDAASVAANQIRLPQNTDHFDFSCSNFAAATYTVTATGKGMMGGFSYTINQAGVRASAVSGVSGWAGNASCWVLKKGGSC